MCVCMRERERERERCIIYILGLITKSDVVGRNSPDSMADTKMSFMRRPWHSSFAPLAVVEVVSPMISLPCLAGRWDDVSAFLV